MDQGRIIKELTEATENGNSSTKEVEPKMVTDAVDIDQGGDGDLVNEGIMMEYELLHAVGVDGDHSSDYDSETGHTDEIFGKNDQY